MTGSINGCPEAHEFEDYRLTTRRGMSDLPESDAEIWNIPNRTGPLGISAMAAFQETGVEPAMNGADLINLLGYLPHTEHPCLYWGRCFLHELGLAEWELSRPKSALAPQFQDLWTLYWFIRDNQPQSILEYGVGHSSVVMALACFHNQRGVVQSIDEEAGWAGSVARGFPKPLQPHWAIMLSRTIQRHYNGQLVLQYVRSPTAYGMVPDFIYIDAPDLFKGAGLHHDGIVDPLYYEHLLKPGCVIAVDGRDGQCIMMQKYFKRNWEMRDQNKYDQRFFILQPD